MIPLESFFRVKAKKFAEHRVATNQLQLVCLAAGNEGAGGLSRCGGERWRPIEQGLAK